MELRLAVYHPWIHLTGGAERALVELARRSRHRVTLFTSHYQPDGSYPELADLDVRVVDRVPVGSDPWSAAASAARIALRKLDLADFDALLVVCEGLGDLILLRNSEVPAYNLCLTPLRAVFDEQYRAMNGAGRGRLERWASALGGALFRTLDRLVWRRYRQIFPISEEVRLRILRGGLAPDAKLRVLRPGVDLDRFEPSADVERTFFVPGRIVPTKRLELAIEAFQRFRAQHEEEQAQGASSGSGSGWKLRIAGRVDRKSEPYLAQLRALAAGQPDIELHVSPSDAEMDAMYRGCACTLFTATNEDWGLVLLEAMASAKPVLSVNRGAPLSIVSHNGDGLLVDSDAQSFAEAMRRIAEEEGLRERLAEGAVLTAQRFGWEGFVDQLDAELEADYILATAPGGRGRGSVLREWAI